MKKHIVIDGNAFYEVDEECLEAKKRCREQKEQRIRRAQMAETASLRQSRRRPGI